MISAKITSNDPCVIRTSELNQPESYPWKQLVFRFRQPTTPSSRGTPTPRTKLETRIKSNDLPSLRPLKLDTLSHSSTENFSSDFFSIELLDEDSEEGQVLTLDSTSTTKARAASFTEIEFHPLQANSKNFEIGCIYLTTKSPPIVNVSSVDFRLTPENASVDLAVEFIEITTNGMNDGDESEAETDPLDIISALQIESTSKPRKASSIKIQTIAAADYH